MTNMQFWILVIYRSTSMIPIPDDILKQYEAVLKKRAVAISLHADYKKWLRYYLDFRSKYPLPNSKSEHVRKKNQSIGGETGGHTLISD